MTTSNWRDKAVTEARVTPTGLELTYLTQINSISDLRGFNDNAGELRRLVDSEGAWTTLDTSRGGNNTVNVSPPIELQPTLIPDTYMIESYRERDESDGAGLSYEVDIRLIRETPRNPEDTTDVLSETQDTNGEWLFEFAHGTIAPTRVQRSEQSNYEDVSLELRLAGEQAEVLFESATRIDAVSTERIPDGDDFVRDTNDDNRNTVTITKAADANADHIPTSGVDYVLLDWDGTLTNHGLWSITMDVRAA